MVYSNVLLFWKITLNGEFNPMFRFVRVIPDNACVVAIIIDGWLSSVYCLILCLWPEN